MPKVSVIIPNYNHSRYLKTRLDSVLAQSFQDIEVILLDDCSSDDSRSVIESYRSHPKVSAIVYNTENSGNTFLQWKKGIELSKGDWVWIAESDDWCEASLLTELFKGTTKPECVLSFCQSLVVRDNEVLPSKRPAKLEEFVDGEQFIINSLLGDNEIVNASMCLFSRATYNQVSQEFTQYQFMGDCLFWTEIAAKGNVYISGKTLNYFRKHPDDVTSRAHAQGLYYSEYMDYLKYLRVTYNLFGEDYLQLLSERYKRFLIDGRIENKFSKQLKNSFKAELGIIYYREKLVLLKTLTRRKLKGS
jgi:glycosyltransferase involved in cell wall biosynthesis